MVDEHLINQLATSRYTGFQPWMGVPIAISIGKPKWMPGIDQINALCPWGLKNIVSDFEFTERYKEQMDRRSSDIHRDLLRLSAKYPGQRLVLLCWENLDDPKSEICHRTVAAEWLRDKGLKIDEINPLERVEGTVSAPGAPSARSTPPPPPELPPTLF